MFYKAICVPEYFYWFGLSDKDQGSAVDWAFDTAMKRLQIRKRFKRELRYAN
jgi:hypothetical protein